MGEPPDTRSAIPSAAVERSIGGTRRASRTRRRDSRSDRTARTRCPTISSSIPDSRPRCRAIACGCRPSCGGSWPTIPGRSPSRAPAATSSARAGSRSSIRAPTCPRMSRPSSRRCAARRSPISSSPTPIGTTRPPPGPQGRDRGARSSAAAPHRTRPPTGGERDQRARGERRPGLRAGPASSRDGDAVDGTGLAPRQPWRRPATSRTTSAFALPEEQRPVLGRPRHGVVDLGRRAAGRLHERLHGLPRQAARAGRDDLLARPRRARARAAALRAGARSTTAARARPRSSTGSPPATGRSPTSSAAIYQGFEPGPRRAPPGLSVFAHLEDLVARGIVATDGRAALTGEYRLG